VIARWFAFAERGTDAATEVRATNYLLALAPGMGLNAVVAFELVAGPRGRSFNGIGAGFVTHTAIKTLGGRAGQVPWLMHVAAAAFVVYFALPLLQRLGS